MNTAGSGPASTAGAHASSRPFATTAAGEVVLQYRLENAAGTVVEFLSHGGTITRILTADRDGRLGDITLGFDDLAGYVEHPGNRYYVGALIGRNANRIANAMLVTEGETRQLARNDGAHNLHTGPHGFHAAPWSVTLQESSRETGAELRHTSAAGDDGYPGTVEARVCYTLTDDNEFRIEYEATCDAPTPVNPTQHTYFNLAADPRADILDHELFVDASRYTPVSATLIPLGVHASVAGTPFDLREPAVIRAAMRLDHPQIALGNGYDHNFVLDTDGDETRLAASLRHPASGRVLDLYTTERGVQIYAGGTFVPALVGKGRVPYPTWAGIALETQAFPDAPNQPGFPTTILHPSDVYRSRTVWRFGID